MKIKRPVFVIEFLILDDRNASLARMYHTPECYSACDWPLWRLWIQLSAISARNVTEICIL